MNVEWESLTSLFFFYKQAPNRLEGTTVMRWDTFVAQDDTAVGLTGQYYRRSKEEEEEKNRVIKKDMKKGEKDWEKKKRVK